jgi:hypothetical protein
MDDRIQPRRASRRWRQYPFSEALSEDLAPAQDSGAAEAASDYQKLYDPPRERKIGHPSSIAAMDASGNRSARWTQTNASGRSDNNDGFIVFVVRTLYNKPTRHQTRAMEYLLHGADSPQIKAPDIPPTASKVSQSPYSTPKHSKDASEAEIEAARHCLTAETARTAKAQTRPLALGSFGW